MNSSKREKTPWTKFRKKPGLKKKGEYLFDESRRKEFEKKPTRANSWRRPRFLDRPRLIGCLVF